MLPQNLRQMLPLKPQLNNMKIDSQYKLREVVSEKLILVQGSNPGDLTKVIALNDTSVYLWDALHEKEFELSDVVCLLTSRYEVDESVALADATKWVETFKAHGIII